MILFLIWWTFDDHLAAFLNIPEVGHLPWWVLVVLELLVWIDVLFTIITDRRM